MLGSPTSWTIRRLGKGEECASQNYPREPEETKRLGSVSLSVCDMMASGGQIYELISFPNMI